ncbi:hypothetical protein Pla52o_56820 [Novipirellula galeiformis]|uniref:Uncharacterized protein n=1 Tax=Novipirellula galeiformis TaxID=2528004 RepID=A0A5C6BGB9_9BACT|nr:hypothetical protein Pla52o_56820 [Novipirellula galeiformis]
MERPVRVLIWWVARMAFGGWHEWHEWHEWQHEWHTSRKRQRGARRKKGTVLEIFLSSRGRIKRGEQVSVVDSASFAALHFKLSFPSTPQRVRARGVIPSVAELTPPTKILLARASQASKAIVGVKNLVGGTNRKVVGGTNPKVKLGQSACRLPQSINCVAENRGNARRLCGHFFIGNYRLRSQHRFASRARKLGSRCCSRRSLGSG